tara:strand:- start:6241 stop:6894 length:654 start_codon:yes stop_codon:yes gene_type:complete
MAGEKEIMVEPDPPNPTPGDYGGRTVAIIQGSFPNSPVSVSGTPGTPEADGESQLDDASLAQEYFSDILKSPILSGFCFSSFDPRYTHAPIISEMTAGGPIPSLNIGNGAPIAGEALDGSTWPVPTVISSPANASPAGQHNTVGALPSYQQSWTGPVIKQTSNGFGAGTQAPLDPGVTSQELSSQDFRTLRLGRSSINHESWGADSAGRLDTTPDVT